MRHVSVLATIAILLLTNACQHETRSVIVDYAVANGSGDLTLASNQSIKIWLRQHPETAIQLRSMCRAVRPGDATWGETTEGHLCTAVNQAAFFGFGVKR